MNSIPLSTERLNLRRFKERDAEFIFENLSKDQNAKRYLNTPNMFSILESKSLIQEWIKEFEDEKSRVCRWLIETCDTRKQVGYICVSKNNYVLTNSYSVSYWISEKERGHNYSLEALTAIIKYLFKHLNALRIDAEVNVNNIASMKIVEKANMKLDGIMRNFYCDGFGNLSDIAIYSIIPDDF